MAQGQSGGFSVRIAAVDAFTPTVQRIGKELVDLSKQLDSLKKQESQPAPSHKRGVAGFFELVKTGGRAAKKEFRELGGEIKEFGKKVAESTEPLLKVAGIGGIAGIASLAGFVEMLNKTAEAGAEVRRTAQRIGVGVVPLQQLGNAAAVAGSSFHALESGLDVLGQKLTGAALGQDSQAIAFFRQFHIQVRNADGTIRSADSALGDLADALHSIRNPIVQAQAATIALGSAGTELLPFLRDGRKGLVEFREEAEHYGYFLSEKGVTASREFERAQADMKIAVVGLGNAITEDVLPVLTPMIRGMAEWVAQNREWIAQDIADLVKSLGAWLKAIDWKSASDGVKNFAEGVGSLVGYLKWCDEHREIIGLVLGAYAGARVGGVYGAIGGAVAGTYAGARSEGAPGPQVVTAPIRNAPGYNPPGGMPGSGTTRTPGGAPPGGATPGPPTAPSSGGLGGILSRTWHGLFGSAATQAAPMPGFAAGTPVASQIVGSARAAGADNGAIQAMIAGALGEGNINEPWKKGDNGTSFGMWQLHQGGELNRYLREGNAAGNVPAQTDYVLNRLNEIMPGFSKSTDLGAQIDAVRRFEGSVYGNEPGSTYYSRNLAGAGRVLQSVDAAGTPAAPAAVPAAPVAPAPAPSPRPYGTVAQAPVPAATPASPAPDALPDAGSAPRRPFPPWIKFNSRGDPYEFNWTSKEKANADQSESFIKANPKSWLLPTAPVTPAPSAPVTPGADAAPIDPAGGGAAPASGTDSSGDTRHHVEIDIKGAPEGTRTRVAEASGPAQIRLRTGYAMPGYV